MKKRFLLAIALVCSPLSAYAADLIEVYQQALTHDTIYQQAVSQRFVTKEGVPISLASLLPSINITANPSVTRSAFAGANTAGAAAFSPRNNTLQYYQLALNLNQTVFNYSQVAALEGALANSNGADATLNAALQSLMTRVSSAYFAVLNDEDNVSYNEAYKRAYAEQLDQVQQQYEVGLKTITDVYTAEASYQSAAASLIAAQTQLSNDRENLRVITGRYYERLSSLSEDFPLLTPHPLDVETWVKTAQQQNWSIKASLYNVENAKYGIRQQFAGNLPTVSFQGTLDRIYTNNINGYRTIDQRSGPSTETDRIIGLNINVPLISGGGTVAATNQATYNYQIACEQLEQNVRNTTNTTRQSYLNIIAGISKISADKQAIKSNISSVAGMEASYRVGTETLVNVLNQQQKLFQAQTQYATDRYAYVNNILALKQAAGTLSFDDLRAINAWLTDKERTYVGRSVHRPGKAHSTRTKKRMPSKTIAPAPVYTPDPAAPVYTPAPTNQTTPAKPVAPTTPDRMTPPRALEPAPIYKPAPAYAPAPTSHKKAPAKPVAATHKVARKKTAAKPVKHVAAAKTHHKTHVVVAKAKNHQKIHM